MRIFCVGFLTTKIYKQARIKQDTERNNNNKEEFIMMALEPNTFKKAYEKIKELDRTNLAAKDKLPAVLDILKQNSRRDFK